MKKCAECGQKKNLDQFYKNRTRKDKHSELCIPCKKRLDREYYQLNRDKILGQQKERSSTRKKEKREYDKQHYKENRERLLSQSLRWHAEHREEDKVYHIKHNRTPQGKFSAYKASAKEKGVPFDLTLEDHFTPEAPNTFWQKPCLFGCAIDTIGIDRIDSSKGYTTSNTQNLCENHNKMKLDHSMEEFVQMCDQVCKWARERQQP